MAWKKYDIIGKKFGRLTVLEVLKTKPRKCLCQCDCGKQSTPRVIALLNARTKSCGCTIKEMSNRRFDLRMGKKFS